MKPSRNPMCPRCGQFEIDKALLGREGHICGRCWTQDRHEQSEPSSVSTPAQDATALADAQYIVEGIILRRLHEKRIEGYTLEMSREITNALRPTPSASAGPQADADSYRNIIDEAMIVRHLGVAKGDARSEFDQILNWEVSVALDPRVSERAQALIDQGRSAPSASAGLWICIVPGKWSPENIRAWTRDPDQSAEKQLMQQLLDRGFSQRDASVVRQALDYADLKVVARSPQETETP